MFVLVKVVVEAIVTFSGDILNTILNKMRSMPNSITIPFKHKSMF
jgi:hypothetical protein